MKQAIPFIAIFFFAMPLALAQEGRLRALSEKEQAIRLERAHTIMENQDLPPAIQEFVEDHGWRSGRIVGGEDADIAMFPWHVGLMSSWGSQYCAGSIIHPEWILTAAHCSSPSFIRAGVTDRTDDTGQEVDVAYMIDHPDHHSPVQHANDIALIKLSEPLDISDPNVSVIQTVTQADALAGITDPGVMSTITGWGATSQGGPSSDILQKADVPIVSNEDAMDPGGYADGSITDDMLAAGFLGEGGVDACQGDSGGPLVVPDGNGGFRLAGVTTWGTGCARPDYPGIYARVSYFEEWIREYVELVDPDAPAKPANFKATAGDMGALQVELSWENPDRTVGDDPLNDLDIVHLYRNGELIYTIDDPTIGGSETYMDEDLTESGIYAYTVLGENDNGEGISAIVTTYVGIDYPGAPEDVHLTADGNDGVLKWNAPTEGLHGGYFNDSNLTYTIVRLPDEVEVASGIAEENFTDSQVPEAGNYLYAVTTHNDKGKGGTGESNAVLLGAENHLIFEGFEDEWPPLGWINNGWEQSTWGDPHSGEEFAYSNLAGSTLKTPVITLPENNKYRLTFYFRAESIDYPQDLDVRISVNNGDFSNIFSVAGYDNATYEEVTVSLAEYDGSDVQIKFVGLTGAGGWAYGVLLDDVSVYMPFDNDLAAESISGITTPSAGIESNYTIEVTNAGLLTQDEYVVKLMQEGDVEIASVDGQPIESGETLSYELPWTPEEEGPTYIYGYVDFPDDEAPGNNQTPPLNISVQPGDLIVTSIGDGEALDQQPFNFLWNYSISQTLYFPHEIGIEGGVITGLQYYNNFSRDFEDTEIMIFLGETEAEDLSSGWTDPASLDLVFEGYYDFPAGEHELFFSFDDIYIYGGGNLVIYTVKGFPDWDLANQFYNTTDEGSNRSRRAQNDDTPYDPLNPEADGTTNDRFPNVSLFFSTAGLGALEGTVTENDDPLEGVKVKVMGTNSVAETNEDGEFEFSALLADTYDIHFSKLGYNDITLDDVVVEEDQTTTINASMDAIPTVTVSGFVGGSDYPDVGIEGAAVKLMGYDDYEVHTNADGEFEITGVYVHNVYDIYVSYEGYYSYADKITLDDTDMELDDIILTEIAFPVSDVVAEEVTEGAMISWGEPAPSEFRYDDGVVDNALGFPQGNWNSVMGAAHFRSAELHEITWLLTEDETIGPRATVKVWVLGLDEDGMPDRDNVLYEAEDVTNTDNEWTTYEFSSPVDAPGGFFIGISYDGFLGLATDDGVGEPWEFVPGTQFAVSDISDPDIGFFCISEEGFEINYLLRSYGLDFGPAKTDARYYADTPLTGPAPTAVSLNPGFDAGSPEYSLSTNANLLPDGRALETFEVWRFLVEDEADMDAWTQIAEGIEEREYMDDDWFDLDAGIYKYAVVAVYTNEVQAPPALSNELALSMEVAFTVNVTTNSGDSPEGAQLTLANQTGDEEHLYTMTADADGEVVFPAVWMGTYDLHVALEGFEDYETHDIEIDDDGLSYDAELIEQIVAPFGLIVETEGHGPGEAHFSWNNVLAEELFEGFEDEFPPQGWHKINPDGGTGWIQLAAGTSPLPGWNIGEAIAAPDGGDFMAYASWQQGGDDYNDQWLVTPEMIAAEGFEFSFYLRYYPDSFEDNLDIRISTTDQDDVAAFDIIVEELTFTEGSSENWELYTYHITDFVEAGQSFYLAFREHVDDNFNDGAAIMLDNVYFGPAKSRTTPEPLTHDERTLSRDSHRNMDSVYDPGTKENKAFLGFNVYLNDEMVAEEIEETEYLFTELPAGDHTAGVQSVYTTGPSEIVETDFHIEDVVETYAVNFHVEGNNGEIMAEVEQEEINSGDQVEEEKDVLFTAIPDDGYEVLEWTVNGDVINDHTGITYTYEDLGQDITVTVGFIADDVSIADLEDVEIQLYPNPAKNMLHIEANTVLTELRMVDMLGNTVYEASLEGKAHQIQVAGLLPGVYFLQVTSETGIVTKRVQVTH